jgi:hypothetical protein
LTGGAGWSRTRNTIIGWRTLRKTCGVAFDEQLVRPCRWSRMTRCRLHLDAVAVDRGFARRTVLTDVLANIFVEAPFRR